MMPALRALLLLILLSVVAGCARLPALPEEPADEQAWAERRVVLAALEHWQVEGRVAVMAGDEGWSASLRWEQDGEFMDFLIRGPMGTGTTRIQGDANWMVVEDSSGDRWGSRDPAAELEARTGWRVPLTKLRWWMLGLPDPGVDAQTDVDGAGRLVRLRQAGWTIHYDRYEEREGVILPGRINVESEDVRVRIVARDWQLFASPPGVLPDDQGREAP